MCYLLNVNGLEKNNTWIVYNQLLYYKTNDFLLVDLYSDIWLWDYFSSNTAQKSSSELIGAIDQFDWVLLDFTVHLDNTSWVMIKCCLPNYVAKV